MAASPPRVFISYSHDSAQPAELVLRFAERLRKDGIDAQLDQYVGGRPPEGWPRWMLDKLDWADFVLLICTESFYHRFRGKKDPGRGRGVDWEGQLITLEIYSVNSHTMKFIPVVFDAKDREFVPEPLSDHVYCLDSEESYGELYSFLTGQAGVVVSELGTVKKLPSKDVQPLDFIRSDRRSPATCSPETEPDQTHPYFTDYFCYISRAKVDQLFNNLVPVFTDEWNKQSTSESNLALEAQSDWNIAQIVTLFKTGPTYGRKGVIQREQRVKLHYVEKLRRILVAITEEAAIPSLQKCLGEGTLSNLYYHYTGSFTLDTPISDTSPSTTIVSLRSQVDRVALVLDCSLRFFSDGNQSDQTFHVQSGNYRFFKHKLPLTLESVFILLNIRDQEILGTPLYLKLSSDSFVSL
jgi:SEFIR domain